MRTLIITTVVLGAALAASAAQAGIFGWGNNCGPAVQAAPVAAAPAPVTTARAENGYRSFSYQPAPVYAASAAGYIARPNSGAFHGAGWKIRGF